MPDALALLNVEDVRHLARLTWVVYDGILLVGPRPKLSGDHPWCTVLAGLQRHIYRGHDDMAHCPPQKLSSWDHERVEALHRVGSLSSAQSGRRRASRSRRRSRSGSCCRFQTAARDGQSCAMSPHTPSRCPHGVTLLPCATVRCYCGAATSHMSAPHQKWLRRSTLPPTPGPATLVKGWAGPRSIMMRHWKMISKLNIHWPTILNRGKAGMFQRKPRAEDWVPHRH